MARVGEDFSARGLLGKRRLVGTLTSLKSLLWTFHIYTQGERTVFFLKKKLPVFHPASTLLNISLNYFENKEGLKDEK